MPWALPFLVCNFRQAGASHQLIYPSLRALDGSQDRLFGLRVKIRRDHRGCWFRHHTFGNPEGLFRPGQAHPLDGQRWRAAAGTSQFDTYRVCLDGDFGDLGLGQGPKVSLLVPAVVSEEAPYQGLDLWSWQVPFRISPRIFEPLLRFRDRRFLRESQSLG